MLQRHTNSALRRSHETNVQQEGLAVASIARDVVVVEMIPPRDDNAR